MGSSPGIDMCVIEQDQDTLLKSSLKDGCTKGRKKTNFGCYSSSGRGFMLKTVDTFGYCQRLVFSLGVSQHMHRITNL